jgi:predicted RNA binding protein YcfA (HicA-like mRNA interferase family)
MSEVPRITAREAISAFERAGFNICRQNKHAVMKKEGHPARLTIPVHSGKTLGVGLMASLIKAAGLTVEQFNDLR